MENRKLTFLALSQFVHHHLLWFLISAYAVAAVFPTTGLWIRHITFDDIPISQTKIHVSLLCSSSPRSPMSQIGDFGPAGRILHRP